jgi:hypothetical protein
MGVGVCTRHNQHRQRSKAGFSEQSNENLDTATLIEVLLTGPTKRKSTSTQDVASKPEQPFSVDVLTGFKSNMSPTLSIFIPISTNYCVLYKHTTCFTEIYLFLQVKVICYLQNTIFFKTFLCVVLDLFLTICETYLACFL